MTSITHSACGYVMNYSTDTHSTRGCARHLLTPPAAAFAFSLGGVVVLALAEARWAKPYRFYPVWEDLEGQTQGDFRLTVGNP